MKLAYNSQHFSFVKEILLFFSDLAFNRNYLWKKELKVYFPKEYLLPAIFKGDLPKDLRSAFCKLATSLYIDHEPFFPAIIPNMCRVYDKSNKLSSKDKNLKSSTLQYGLTNIFKSPLKKKDLNKEKNLENNKKDPYCLYKDLIENLRDYIAGFEEEKTSDEFLYNALDLLFLIIRLDIITLINPNREDFHKLVRNLILMLEYDSKNSKLNKILIENRRKKEEKSSVFNENYLKSFHKNFFKIINLKTSVFTLFQSSSKQNALKKPETPSPLEENKLLENNPIIKGLYQMVHSLKSLETDSLEEKPFEIAIKLKILEILTFFHELRQDSLLTRFEAWFNTFSKKLLLEKKSKSLSEEEINKIVSNFIENDLNDRLPELFLTGIEEIDSHNEETLFSDLLSLGKKGLFKGDSSKEETIKDLNAFFTKPESGKEISILPSLCLLFYQNKHPEIEKRLLRLISKLYNQREELLHNILTLEMIFDRKEAEIFGFLQEKINWLRTLIEKSELWMSRFALNPENPKESDKKAIESVTKLLKQMNLFLFSDSGICEGENEKNEEVLMFNEEKLDEIQGFLKGDEIIIGILKERQNLMQFSKGHIPIINLIKDCLHHLPSILLNNNISKETKGLLIEMFSMAFITLRHFCFKNQQNQMILYGFLEVFEEYLQYDLGQISLISAIFIENKLLLERITADTLKPFFLLIENEGRQAIFLDFFLLIQAYKNEYLQENQSLILNEFLPAKLTEKEHKFLYSFSKNQQISRFYFDESFIKGNERLSLLEKLEEMGFQDTYRDEPFYYHARLLEVLRVTTKGGGLMNFAVNKLKKAFNVEYLVDLLMEEDGFCFEFEEEGFKGEIERNPKEDNGILEENIKESSFIKENNTILDENIKESSFIKESFKIEKKTKIKENLIKGSIAKAKGFSYLKPFLLNFLNEIHFNTKNKSELTVYQCKLRQLIEFETKRIQRESFFSNDYIDYFFNDLLSLLLDIYEFFFKRVSFIANEDSSSIELEEMEDYSLFVQLKEVLIQKYDIFIPKLKNTSQKYNFNRIIQVVIQNDQQPIQNPAIIPIKSFNLRQDILPKIDPNLLLKAFFQKAGLSALTIVSRKNTKGKFSETSESPQKTNVDESPYIKTSKGKKECELTEENLWFFFKNGLINSKALMKELDNEKKVLSEVLLKLPLMFEQEGDSKQTKTFSPLLEAGFKIEFFIKKLIDFIQFGFKDPEKKDSILILLQVLKRMIDANSNKEALYQIQELFRKLGITKMICIILVDNNDSDLLIRLLSFTSSLLKRGNSSIQAEFLVLFRSGDCEGLFLKLHGIIRKEIESIETIARFHQKDLLINEGENVKRTRVVSKEVYREIFELSRTKQGDLLKKLLDFLILLVEGHNLEMQGFISKQPKARNSFDLVSDIIDLLVAFYFNSPCHGLYRNIDLCFDAIIAFVQGPCFENQLLILDSPLMELARDLFQFKESDPRKRNIKVTKKRLLDEKKEESGSKSPGSLISEGPSPVKRNPREKSFIFNEETIKKGRDLSESQVARLQYKLLVLINAVLEERNIKESDLIMKKISQALPREILEKKMLEIYENWKKGFSKQYVLAGFKNFEEKGNKGGKNKLERMFQGKEYQLKQELCKKTILESGFLIYFLIAKEMEGIEGGKVTVIDELNKGKLTKEFNILGDNILGKMMNFITNLIRSILSYMKSNFFSIFLGFLVCLGVKKVVQEQTLDRLTNKDEKKEEKEENIKKKRKKIRKVSLFYNKILIKFKGL